jgi:outer membrane protein assembly factor BamB
LASTLFASDWPAYAGPNGDRTTSEKINLNWSATGPKQIWKVPTTAGFSSFAVAEGKAFTMMTRKVEGTNREFVVAFNAPDGKDLWAVDVGPAKYQGGGDTGAKDNAGGDGPRCTPTVSDGKVYVYTPKQVLYCLDAGTGKEVWTKDVMKDFSGRRIDWDNATSPVIEGDLVLVGGGGANQSLLAFNKTTGTLAWKTGTERITHATPVLGTILGVRQLIFFLQSGLVSVDPKTGAELWRFPFRFAVSTAASPVICGDIVYCSAGYGVGGGACKLAKSGDKFTVTELYKIEGDKKIANHWSTPVFKDGYLYGMFSFKEFGTGKMKCVDPATGAIKWEKPGFGAGQVILVDGKVLGLSDFGELVSVEATPAAYKELSRAKVVAGKCWSTPTVSNGRIYVRSTKEGLCLDPGQ